MKRVGYPNVYGTKMPIPFKWDLNEFKNLLHGYHDNEIIQFLKFGWPANRLLTMPPPTKNCVNHNSMIEHPEFIDKYIEKEMRKRVIIGPFTSIPFTGDRIGISPLSTRPKKGNTDDRRTIMDLSFPEGSAMNHYILKDSYLGIPIKLKFTTVDALACRMVEIGKDCRMWKCDLQRAFHQVGLDPADYELFGFVWKGLMCWETVLWMCHCIAPYIMQKITNAIKFIHCRIGLFLLNYVDDF